MTARRPAMVFSVVAVVVAALPAPAQSAAPRQAAGWESWAPFAHPRWAGPAAATRLSASPRTASPFGAGAGSRVPRVPVALPQTVGLSRATRTLYATADTGVVSVIDADRCNARRDSGCGAPVAVIDGAGSGDVTVDERSGTGYVTSPDTGTVTVFDVTRCNAHRTAGCADAHPSVTTGGFPIGLAVNERTRTLYVGNGEAFVSVIDMRGCNRSQSAGCAAAPAQVATNPGAVLPTVDEATNTVYAPEQGEENQFPPADTVAVIDGSRCNASVISGCGQTPAHATAGADPAIAAVDPRTRTLYVENANDLNVSVFDAATCNGRDASGCGQLATARVGNEPNSNLVIDQASRTLFVINTESDTISALDASACNARDTSGCGRSDLTVQTGNLPFWIELDKPTGTLFVTEHIDEDVAAFDARTCNARHRSGCRHEAPTAAIPDGVWSTAADPPTHTLYAGGGEHGKLSLLDTRICHAGRTGGCRQTPFEFQLAGADGSQLNDLLLDPATHTLYAIDTASDRLFVLDAATCNTGRHDSCAPLATVATGARPVALALNPGTGTLYVVDMGDAGVKLFDAAHCNATDIRGCASAPATVMLDGGPNGIAVDPDSDTAYVSRVRRPDRRPARRASASARSPTPGTDRRARARPCHAHALRGQLSRLRGRGHQPQRRGGRHPRLQRPRSERLRPDLAHHPGRARAVGAGRRPGHPPRVHHELLQRDHIGDRRRALQRDQPRRLRPQLAAGGDRQHLPRRRTRGPRPHALHSQRARPRGVGHRRRPAVPGRLRAVTISWLRRYGPL